MRDFRDAKSMAQTLREALKTKSISLTHGECLDLIAKIFGLADWNVLSARIRTEMAVSPEPASASDSPRPSAPPRTEAEWSAPASLDNFVGFYRLDQRAVMTVTREGAQLSARLTGQPPLPIFPRSESEFDYRAIDARIVFVAGADGPAASLVLHQGGGEAVMQRIDAATARGIAEETAERVRLQSPTPGAEQALRRLIDGLMSGVPNYGEMSAALAGATRHQLPTLQQGLMNSGPVRSLTFIGVAATGDDVFSVMHENGPSHWRIGLDRQGRISTARVTP